MWNPLSLHCPLEVMSTFAHLGLCCLDDRNKRIPMKLLITLSGSMLWSTVIFLIPLSRNPFRKTLLSPFAETGADLCSSEITLMHTQSQEHEIITRSDLQTQHNINFCCQKKVFSKTQRYFFRWHMCCQCCLT